MTRVFYHDHVVVRRKFRKRRWRKKVYPSQLPPEIWSMIIDFRTISSMERFVDFSVHKHLEFIDIVKILSKDINKTSDETVTLYNKYIDIITDRYSPDSLSLNFFSEELTFAQHYLHDYDWIGADFLKPFPTLKVDLHGTFFRNLFIKDGYFSIRSLMRMEPHFDDYQSIVEEYLYGYENEYHTFRGLNGLKDNYDDYHIQKSIVYSFAYLVCEYENTLGCLRGRCKDIFVLLIDEIKKVYSVPFSEYVKMKVFYKGFDIEISEE